MPIMPVDMTRPNQLASIAQAYNEGALRNNEMAQKLEQDQALSQQLSAHAKAYQDEIGKLTDPSEVVRTANRYITPLEMNPNPRAQQVAAALKNTTTQLVGTLEKKESAKPLTPAQLQTKADLEKDPVLKETYQKAADSGFKKAVEQKLASNRFKTSVESAGEAQRLRNSGDEEGALLQDKVTAEMVKEEGSRAKSVTEARVRARNASLPENIVRLPSVNGKEQIRVRKWNPETNKWDSKDELLGTTTSVWDKGVFSGGKMIVNGTEITGWIDRHGNAHSASELGLKNLGDKGIATQLSAENAADKISALSNRLRDYIAKNGDKITGIITRAGNIGLSQLGEQDPEYKKMDFDANLMQTLLAQMHVGGRPAQALVDKFRDLINVSMTSPQNVIAALDELDKYAADVKYGRYKRDAWNTGDDNSAVDINMPKPSVGKQQQPSEKPKKKEKW